MYKLKKFGWRPMCLIGAAVSAICSCGDILDSAPDGKITLNDVFTDSEKTAAWLNTCYTYIPAGGMQYFFVMRGPVDWSDESWDADAEAEPSIKSGQYYAGKATAAAHPILREESKFWDVFWPAIRKCTYLIDRIDASPVDETDKSRWKAEAHLLRAYYYSELLRWFGCGMPIERETYSYTQDFSQIRRASYYETVQFVLEDCDAALSSPDLPWRIVTAPEGHRGTKALAEAVKARMILYAASPLYNQGQDRWEEAYQINKTALEHLRANGYELYNAVNYPATWEDPEVFLPNTSAKLFNEYFCSTMVYASNPLDRETIYQTIQGQDNVWAYGGVGAQLGYKTGTCPSQELIDCFETDDGIPILDLARPYLDEVTHLQPNYHPNVKYDEQNPYVDRDPRFYASFYYNGTKRKANWLINETSDCYENYDENNPATQGYRTRVIATWTGEPQTGIHPTDRKATRTGYYQRKFLHPFAGLAVNDIAGAQYKAFRLGELILNFAEAAAEAGHLDEAWAAVNEIRRRVNMPDLPAGLSKNDLILRIRHERRVELALEGFRYFDVRRWSSPGDDLEKTDRWITAMHITRNSDGSYTHNRGPVSVERYCWSSKFLYLPIPMDEVNIMLSHTGENWQNPGWE